MQSVQSGDDHWLEVGAHHDRSTPDVMGSRLAAVDKKAPYEEASAPGEHAERKKCGRPLAGRKGKVEAQDWQPQAEHAERTKCG